MDRTKLICMQKKPRLTQTFGHSCPGRRVRVPLQIPTREFSDVLWRRAHFGQCARGLLIAPELGIARCKNKRAVRVRPDPARCQRGLDRLRVATKMIEHAGFVAEPG